MVLMNAWKFTEVSLNFLKCLSKTSVFFNSERQRLNFEPLKALRQRSPFSRHSFRHLIKTTTFRASLNQAPGSSLTKSHPMQEHSHSCIQAAGSRVQLALQNYDIMLFHQLQPRLNDRALPLRHHYMKQNQTNQQL